MQTPVVTRDHSLRKSSFQNGGVYCTPGEYLLKGLWEIMVLSYAVVTFFAPWPWIWELSEGTVVPCDYTVFCDPQDHLLVLIPNVTHSYDIHAWLMRDY